MLSVVVLAGLALIALDATRTRADLQAARSSLAEARAAAVGTDRAAADRPAARARDRAASAAGRTQRWHWRAAGRLPVVDVPVLELQALSAAAARVTRDVVPPLLDTDPVPARWTGRVDLAALARARTALDQADRQADLTLAELDRAPRSRISELASARTELGKELRAVRVAVHEAAVAAAVLPELLGATGPRQLLVVVQNPAESRGTGGLIGAFAVLRAQAGRFELTGSGSGDVLRDAPLGVADLGADFQARYGPAQSTRTWRSANLSPDLRDAGRILLGLAERQSRSSFDGVVLLDPVSLSFLLEATGPLSLPDGTRLTPANVVDVLLKEVYARFPEPADNAARDRYFQQALTTVVRRLTTGGLSGRAVATAFSQAAATGHLQLYAKEPAAEQRLSGARLGGALPGAGPFLQVVTQDVGGSKLDTYTTREIRYRAQRLAVATDLGAGPEFEEEGQVEVRFRNNAPAQGLPRYVTVRADPGGRGRPAGEARTWLSVYLGPRATLLGATLDGREVTLRTETDRGHSVFSTFLSTAPGAEHRLVLRVRQPSPAGSELVFRQQPRLVDDVVRVERDGQDDFLRVYSLLPR